MKILSIIPNLKKGGAQRIAVRFAIEFQRLGLQSDVFTLSPDGPRASELHDFNIPIFTDLDSFLSPANLNEYVIPDYLFVHSCGIDSSVISSFLVS